VNAALAPTAGRGLLRHTAEGSWGASLYEDEELETSAEDIHTRPLDAILAGDRPQIVKCNAEGAEYCLFDQLTTSDLRPELLIVMVHPEFGDAARLRDQALGMGYRFIEIGTQARPAYQMWRTKDVA
jgi:hypothetical protein